jgi:hypothetical protein
MSAINSTFFLHTAEKLLALPGNSNALYRNHDRMSKLLSATTQDLHILESAIHYAQGRHRGSGCKLMKATVMATW